MSATALFFLFLKIHYTLGLTAIVIGPRVWNSAYAAIIVQARMASLDPALEEAAADLGATPWRTFRRVTLSALLPAIIAAGLLAFTFSFDDVVTSVFLQGASNTPLPVVILGMIRFRITPEINAIGLLVMLFTVTLMSFAVLIYATAGSLGPFRAQGERCSTSTGDDERARRRHRGRREAVRRPGRACADLDLEIERGRVLLDHRAVAAAARRRRCGWWPASRIRRRARSRWPAGT